MVFPQDIHAVFSGEEQVAGVTETKVRGLAAYLDVVVETGNEFGGEHREEDVDRFRELVTDAGFRQRGGGQLVGGVHLDDQNRFIVVGVLR